MMYIYAIDGCIGDIFLNIFECTEFPAKHKILFSRDNGNQHLDNRLNRMILILNSKSIFCFFFLDLISCSIIRFIDCCFVCFIHSFGICLSAIFSVLIYNFYHVSIDSRPTKKYYSKT